MPYFPSLYTIPSRTAVLTEHGFKLDQAADKVVKVNHLIVCITGDQNLIQFVIQFKTYRMQQKEEKFNISEFVPRLYKCK